jgi:hypothetical protein
VASSNRLNFGSNTCLPILLAKPDRRLPPRELVLNANEPLNAINMGASKDAKALGEKITLCGPLTGSIGFLAQRKRRAMRRAKSR